MQTHPEAAEAIYTKQKEINEEWTQLTAKANARKEKLLDSYDLQRFLADYRLAKLLHLVNSYINIEISSVINCYITLIQRLNVLDPKYDEPCIFRGIGK